MDSELPRSAAAVEPVGERVRWNCVRAYFCAVQSSSGKRHTAHESYEDASLYARRIHYEVYNDFLLEVLACPSYVASSLRVNASRRDQLHDRRSVMRDGKALQMMTTHELVRTSLGF